MAKKVLISKQSIKVIENNIAKLENCLKEINATIDRVTDEEVKKYFILQKNDIISKIDISKVALETAKKSITLMTDSNK